jgi:hypothetical protein
MEHPPKLCSRRQLLQYLGVGSLSGLAGCNHNSDSTISTSVTDSSTTTSTPSGSTVPDDNQAPRILSYEATPDESGTILAVSMSGEDNKVLEKAAIVYGDQQLRENPEGETVALGGEFKPDEDFEALDRVVFLLQDLSGNKTQKEVYPDQKAPEVASKTSATENAGELKLNLEGKDAVGLQELVAVLNGERAREKNVSEAEQATIVTTIADKNTETVQRFESNTVTATALDQYDNKTEKTIEQYVRKYDKMENPRLDISVRYIPFAGDALGRCLEDVNLEPAVGYYETSPTDPIPARITSRHIDQMTGHGITKMTVDFNGKNRSKEYIREILQSDLADQIEIEASYGMQALKLNTDRNWKNDVLPEHLSFLNDNLMSHNSVARIKGRPTMYTWNLVYIAWNDECRNKLMDEFGSYEAFVDDMRTHLKVEGEDPFLVAGTDTVDTQLINTPKIRDIVRQFDAVNPWIPGNINRGERTSWEETMGELRKDYRWGRKFADRYGKDLIPTVFPGFNDKENTCHTSAGRHLPRDKNYFSDILRLAEEFATTGLIHVATWNDWVEGTQLEPGSYRGVDYGTDYLEIVEKFQAS